MGAINIKDALKKMDKKYYEFKIEEEYISKFDDYLNKYIKLIDEANSSNEHEDHFINLINRFLNDNFYSSSLYEVNRVKRIDSTIKLDGNLLALIEIKKPKNKTEMSYSNDINRKAFHEIVYYYLQETRDTTSDKVCRKLGVEIRRLIITDTINWILIDTNEIEKICDSYLENFFYKYENKQLIYSNDNEKFYDDLKQYFTNINIESKIQYVFFSILNYKNNKMEELYKIFNKTYLLKESFKQEIKTQELNDTFYQELLYIMGLFEDINKNSITIKINHTIKNSLAEQVYRILTIEKEYDEQIAVDKTFELIITWMNRFLFIKLFEGQLISFNGDKKEYHILDEDKINDFQKAQDLFFEVLGKQNRDNTTFLNQFKLIPYLNSSLFERTKAEKKDINIKEIQNNNIAIKKNTILGKNNNKEIPLLQYIIDFLGSYNFSTFNIQKNKEIIDAAVLGLIFEKLNGYKDGSYYTPSNITEYMSKRSIEKVIINKINEKYKWVCKDLYEIKAKINSSLQMAREINSLINTLKICDISVGSGHFLVSVLNRMIAIKKQLGVLFKYNKDEILTEYDIYISDDILQVFDGQGEFFKYNPNDYLSQQIQETLYNEKKQIIENCLYGVDLNSNAVAICQLRLWIELLKNAYYKNKIMETLPNIDINIKIGNSLINKLNINSYLKIELKNLDLVKKLVSEYKDWVILYKNVSDKKQRNEILRNINRIKDKLNDIYNQNIYNNYDYDLHNNIYQNSFEWVIEFPELLDDAGVFKGFDCIIGNPPYGLINKKQNQNTSISVCNKMLEFYKSENEYSAARGGVLNIYRLFICRCITLLKEKGYCCLIFPLAFMCDLSGVNIRKYTMENTKIDFIEAFPERDSANKRVFKEVKMSVCILGTTKLIPSDSYKFNVRIHHDKFVNEYGELLQISYKDICNIDNNFCTIPLITQKELAIFRDIANNSKRMLDYSKCYTGEVDLSLDKQFVSLSDKNNFMLRGAQIQKYHISKEISQGNIFYLKADDFLKRNKGKRSQHHNLKRIVMQGITGINERWRLKMTIIDKPYFCSNSVNYLLLPTENDFTEYILGVLNSKLLNWYFSKISTNSNVNGYEIDGLPIKLGNKEQYEGIVLAVKELLEKKDIDINQVEYKMQEIDDIVYKIYNIQLQDISIIEK